MDTPITISSNCSTKNSDYLQPLLSPKKCDATGISIGSPRSGHNHLQWDQRNDLYPSSPSSTTLSNIQKVSNWIRSIEGNDSGTESALNDLGIDTPSDSQCFPKYDDMDAALTDSNSKSLIVLQCNYRDRVVSKNYYSALNDSEMLMKYLKKENVKGRIEPRTLSNNLQTNNVKNPANEDKFIKQTAKSKLHFRTQLDNKFSIVKDDLSRLVDNHSSVISDNYEIPTSPESRKKELCSYLQLMNPADKKEIFVLQNRRSVRVRNLTAMQEKIRQRNKVPEESEEKNDRVNDIPSRRPSTLKSFKELNIKVQQYQFKTQVEDEKSTEPIKGVFSFPFPPENLVQIVSDFDDSMSTLGPKWQKELMLKGFNDPCNKKILKHNNAAVNKENVQAIKTKPRHVKPSNKNNDHKSVVSDSEISINKKSMRLSTIKKNPRKIQHLRKKNKRLSSSRPRRNGIVKNGTLTRVLRKKEKSLKDWKVSKKKELRESQLKIRDKLKVQRISLSSEESTKSKMSKSVGSHCEIVTIGSVDDDNNFGNFMDDMVDFENLTEEHKKCLIESRIFSAKPILNNSYNTTPLHGFSKSDVSGAEKVCQNYKETLQAKEKEHIDIERNFESNSVSVDEESNPPIPEAVSTPTSDDEAANEENIIQIQEHDYAGQPDKISVENDVVVAPCTKLPVKLCEFDTRTIVKKKKYELLPYDKTVEMKSLHRSLQFNKKKTSNMESSLTQEWDPDGSPKQKTKKQSHYISVDKKNGLVLKAFYIDYNLVISQELAVSFWIQTPLGNVLGSQNMWIPRGQINKLALNNKCIQKDSMEMVVCTESNVAYIELWTKEHKSDIREGPVADVFATLYFWKQRQNGLEKKVLQLENINGFADDVQYSVMKCLPKIIVSWHSANEDNVSKRTFIHAYQLATDYQTVSNIYNIEPIDHYVSSLHNIEDCENLIMGCGENKVTLWNVEFGYIIATIELTEIRSPLSTLWVKCDRGFLFAIQQCVDRELRLIAINGINHSWKKLASYTPPEGFDRIRGVCIENGLLLSFYDQGILCWKAETGELVEEVSIETDVIPCGKHVILMEESQIFVKHAMTHLMSMSVEDS